jgi:hypothetical protein
MCSQIQDVDGISSDHILELTTPPTAMPTTYDHFLANQEEVAILDSEESQRSIVTVS